MGLNPKTPGHFPGCRFLSGLGDLRAKIQGVQVISTLKHDQHVPGYAAESTLVLSEF